MGSGQRQSLRYLARRGPESATEAAKEARLWLADGSCIRLRAEYPNHVWSYDFVADTTREGRPFRILNIDDEYTRECLAAGATLSDRTAVLEAGHQPRRRSGLHAEN